MRRLMRRLGGMRWNNTGASAVEFALVVPFLILVLFCIFDLSWLLASQTVLNHATFNAARVASRAKAEGLTDAEAIQLAKTRAVEIYWMGALEESDVNVNFNDSGDVPQVEVQTGLDYESLTGWFDAEDLPARLGAKAVTPLQ